jgi:hypothetical protein
MRVPVLILASLVAFLPVLAQQSTSYKLTEHTLNAGGHPAGGTVPSSASYRISLDSIGDGAVKMGMSSASFTMDGSFGACFPPPGEVHGLHFTDPQTLVWDAERSAGDYNLYREPIGSLTGGGYGTCLQQDITGTAATDADPVPSGEGYFYLVTAENRLDEEGTKGTESGGATRQGNVCP